MVCPGCGCEISDLNPFSFCQVCGEPIEKKDEDE